MPFPAAIAAAQREAITNDLREVRVSLDTTLAVLRRPDFQPHLIGISAKELKEVIFHLAEAEKDVFSAIEVLAP